jgi:hypothetical protein
MVRLAPLIHRQAFTVVRSTIVKETADSSVTNPSCAFDIAKFGSFSFVAKKAPMPCNLLVIFVKGKR